MSEYNPLYNEVYDYVFQNLEARAQAYYENDINFANNKIAFGYVESLCDNSSKNEGKILARIGKVVDYQGGYGVRSKIPGIDVPEETKDINNTIYRTSQITSDLEKKSLTRFMNADVADKAMSHMVSQEPMYGRGGYPAIPILKSISITNEGEMGSLQKANLSFTIPDQTLFDVYEELFMRPGRELRVEYGWNKSAGSEYIDENGKTKTNDSSKYSCADSDTFRGVVYNSSWTLNSNLGYDCTVDVVGEGYFTLKAAATATHDDGEKYGDPNYESKVVDLKSRIQADLNKISDESKEDGWVAGEVFLPGIKVKLKGPDIPNRLVYYRKEVLTSEIDTKDKSNWGGDTEKTRATSLGSATTTNRMSGVNYYLSLNQLAKYFNGKVLSHFKNRDYEYEVGEDGVAVQKQGDYKKIIFSFDLEQQLAANNPFDTEKHKIDCDNRKDKDVLDNEDLPYSAGLWVRYLKSADPHTIILPGVRNGNYFANDNDNNYTPKEKQIDDYKIKQRYDRNWYGKDYGKGAACKLVNLGEILISADFIIEVFEKIQAKDDEPINLVISNFFQEIFNRISLETGKIHQLTLVSREFYNKGELAKTTKSKNEIVIVNTVVDTNYTGCGESKPLIFSPRVHRAIVRDFQVSSKLPSATQTAMYAGGRTKISSNVTNTDNFSKLQQNYFQSCGGAKEDGTDKNVETQEKPPKVNKDGEIVTKDGNTQIVDWIKRMKQLCYLIAQNGVNDLYIGELRAIMRHLKTDPEDFASDDRSVLDTAGSWMNRTIYPVDLTITLDGISGFRFGNVISSDWLPAKYRYSSDEAKKVGAQDNDVKVVFVVTKVEHKLDGSDWSTTLQTQCRLGRNVSGKGFDND